MHCNVKSLSGPLLMIYNILLKHSAAAKTGGCFPGRAWVMLESGGRKAMRDLQAGDRVLVSKDSEESRNLLYSEVLTFLDRDPMTRKLFYVISTEDGESLSLTAAHLLFVWEGNCTGMASPSEGTMRTIFTSDASTGQCVLTVEEEEDGILKQRLSRITRIRVWEDRGAYAPLTAHGTLLVNGVMTSCYAAVEKHQLAHWVFGPLRMLHSWTGPSPVQGKGLHWYANALHWVGKVLLDSELLHPWAMEDTDR